MFGQYQDNRRSNYGRHDTHRHAILPELEEVIENGITPSDTSLAYIFFIHDVGTQVVEYRHQTNYVLLIIGFNKMFLISSKLFGKKLKIYNLV